MGSEYHEPEPTETFESDDDEDYEDDEDDNDNEEGVSFFKEHFVALFFALVASVAAHAYNQNGATSMSSFARSLSGLVNSANKHDHLNGFSRTSNVSFCQQESQAAPLSKGFQSMDFYIPRNNFESLATFYVADVTEDDSYAETDAKISNGNIDANGIHGLLTNDEEFKCLFHQHENNPIDRKFKGTTYFYKDPTLEEIYPELVEESSRALSMRKNSFDERKRQLEQPPLSFTGFAAKFVNLHTEPVLLYWDGQGGHEKSRKLVGEIPPMESVGTATMPGHGFHVTPIYDSSTALQRWVVTHDTALSFYEPKDEAEMKKILRVKDPKLYAKYQRQMVNKAFARDYTVVSGRTWLGHFPSPFPMFHMHEASYIGQEHHVGDMTLKVASVRPRVFTIDNFLTPEECEQVIRLGLKQGLTESTLHSSPLATQNRDTSTRSSTNAWLARETSALTQKIYEKTAELTKIDPDLFQKFHDSSAHHHSIAESLQVVRYKKGEEYTPHHDFVSPSINNRHQPSRFATLLIYLNDVEEGGETRFPRAVNNYNSEGLEIIPKVGKAVLFYNTLEDGNMDDLSQHGGNKVLAGNKWLANLWIWDPLIS